MARRKGLSSSRLHLLITTYRGHVDSVNEVCWQPFSNNLCTASSDKTVSIWDARSGLCTQTFYGHHNSCNCVAFNCQVSHRGCEGEDLSTTVT